MYQRLTPTLLMLLASVGCGEGPTSPEQFVSVRTDRNVYEPERFVVVSVENHGFRSVVFYHCTYRFGFVVEQLVADEWLEEYEVTTVCIGILPTGPHELERGAVYRDSVQLNDPGTYRIRFPVGEERDVLLQSNTFEVAHPDLER